MTTQIMPSIKTRFTYRFIRAVQKLNKNRGVSSSMKETYRRYHMIRVASYASMASAVGSKRAWSQAVLRKIRNHTLHRDLKKKSGIHALIRRRKVSENPRNNLNFHQENDLRKLVPGGEDMDFCRLLNETAHYIKCLRTQILWWIIVQFAGTILWIYANQASATSEDLNQHFFSHKRRGKKVDEN